MKKICIVEVFRANVLKAQLLSVTVLIHIGVRQIAGQFALVIVLLMLLSLRMIKEPTLQFIVDNAQATLVHVY